MTFVLVHGAFHGAWCWEPVVDRLAGRGYEAVAVDLPGRALSDAERGKLTLDDYADAVVDAVAGLVADPGAGEPLVLVGHSLGGVVIAQAAERACEHVSQLIYLAAFLPTDGQGVPQLIDDAFRSGSLVARHQEIDRAARVSRFPASAAVDAFYARADPALAAAAAARLVPEALGPQAAPARVTASRYGAVPRAYIETLADATIPLSTQRAMYTAAGVAGIETLDSDHAPQLSAPDALVDALLALTLTR